MKKRIPFCIALLLIGTGLRLRSQFLINPYSVFGTNALSFTAFSFNTNTSFRAKPADVNSNMIAFLSEPLITFVTNTTIYQVSLPSHTGAITYSGIAFTGAELFLGGTTNTGGTGGSIIVTRYSVTGNPPSSLSLIDSQQFGDLDSRFNGLCKTAAGGIITVWHQHTAVETPPGTYTMLVGVGYRSSGGIWTNYYPNLFPSTETSITSANSALCQHPAGDIWSFLKRDASSIISAISMTESGSGLNLTIRTNYISQSSDGVNGPDGETPFLAAIPNSNSNVVLFAYQKNNSVLKQVTPVFIRIAGVAFAAIDGSGNHSFLNFDEWLERITPFGIMMQGPRIGILYGFYDTNAPPEIPTTRSLSIFNGSAWETPITLGTVQFQGTGGYLNNGGGTYYKDLSATNDVLVRFNP